MTSKPLSGMQMMVCADDETDCVNPCEVSEKKPSVRLKTRHAHRGVDTTPSSNRAEVKTTEVSVLDLVRPPDKEPAV